MNWCSLVLLVFVILFFYFPLIVRFPFEIAGCEICIFLLTHFLLLLFVSIYFVSQLVDEGTNISKRKKMLHVTSSYVHKPILTWRLKVSRPCSMLHVHKPISIPGLIKSSVIWLENRIQLKMNYHLPNPKGFSFCSTGCKQCFIFEICEVDHGFGDHSTRGWHSQIWLHFFLLPDCEISTQKRLKITWCK